MKKKGAVISMPPQMNQEVLSKINLDDPALLAMIDGGGGTVSEKKVVKNKELKEGLKNFSIRIYESELVMIKEHLKGLGGRKTKSIHTFIIEAINEKLEREQSC